jgi:hypothetical protein
VRKRKELASVSLLIALLMSTVNLTYAQATIQPYPANPPELINTPLKANDYWTYRCEVNIEGLSFSQLVKQFINSSTVGMNETEFDRYLYTIESAINKTVEQFRNMFLNVTVLDRTVNATTLMFHIYFNETMQRTITEEFELNSTEWGESLFPFILPANYSANILKTNYIDPVLNMYIQKISSSYPELNIQYWFTVDATEKSVFYAGACRNVIEVSFTFNDVITHIKEIFDYFNQSETFNQIPETIRNLDFDINFYSHWDKTTGIFLASKLSVRLSTLSWFAYRAVQVYVSETNLWGTDNFAVVTNALSSFFLGYYENIMTYAISGFVFGDTTAQMMFIGYLFIGILVASLITYILKRIF